MTSFVPGTCVQPISKVELILSCRNLPNLDSHSKSDPFVVVYIRTEDPQAGREAGWTEYSRTEVVSDCLNPDFVTRIPITYYFEQIQSIRFRVYDCDSENLRDLSQHDYMGECTQHLSQLVANSFSRMTLVGGAAGDSSSTDSCLLVHVEEVRACKTAVCLQISASGLPRKAWFSCACCPYLELFKRSSRRVPSDLSSPDDWILVHRTAFVPNCSEPSWPEICVLLDTLCDGDMGTRLRALCWHRRHKEEPNLLGETLFSAQQLLESFPTQFSLQLKGSESGRIHVNKVEYRQNVTFLDYILGGMQIACSVAIDFTSSNGDINDPRSLHYLKQNADTGRPYNEYTQALTATVRILQDYDSDKQFPVLGFGARIPPHGDVSHEFFVNLNSDSPYCNGVDGVLHAYLSCLHQIQLFGPTNFSPIIRHVMNFARNYTDGSHYFVLLMITDGVITDMKDTIESVVEASYLPMSLIIVGVGAANFSSMVRLDSDDSLLISESGRRAARDIVQFVPFRDTVGYDGASQYCATTSSNLARTVLAELPAQIVDYMRSNNIEAKPPRIDIISVPPEPV